MENRHFQQAEEIGVLAPHVNQYYKMISAISFFLYTIHIARIFESEILRDEPMEFTEQLKK